MFPNNSIYWLGKGMGGGSGGMFRTAGRAAARARIASERTSESNSSSSVCISPIAASGDDANKPSFHLFTTSPRRGGSAPVTPNSGIIWPDFDSSPGSPCYDESDWVSLIGSEDENENGFIDDFVLGPAPFMDDPPSDDEVHNAFSALQQVVDFPKLVRDKYADNVGKDTEDQNLSSATALIPRASSVGSRLDWMEPSLHLYTARGLHPSPYGSNRVYDAFHLLQNDPCVQRMVISLSSDRAVWDAVMSNDAVRELRESYYAAGESTRPGGNDDDSKRAVNIVQWIFDNTKVKMMELMEKISKIVTDIFKPPSSGEKMTTAGAMDPFEEKLRASFMLTVMVLLLVMVDRASKA